MTIGKDILRLPLKENGVLFSGSKELRDKTLQILANAERPVSIPEIMKLAGIKSWVGAKSILMELVVNGKVEVFKTGALLLFRISQSKEGQTK